MRASPITARPITASPIAARAISAGQLSPMAEAILPLFTNGVQGVWFDPSDFSTMFQDAAGTTHVTALGQPVGKILDKSPLGKHATCPGATTSRPTIEARVNRLLNSAVTGGGAAPTSWTQPFATGSSAPEASSLYAGETAYVQSGTAQRPFISQDITALANATYQLSMQVESVTGSVQAQLAMLPNSALAGSSFSFPVCEANPSGGATGIITTGKLVATLTISSTSGTVGCRFGLGASGAATGTLKFSRPQVAFNDDQFKNAYQLVNTATDYTDIGAPRYLAFDGTDDWLETAAIDMTGTDSVLAVAGIRKNSDSVQGFIAEFSASFASNAGSFHLTSSLGATPSYGFSSRGSATGALADAMSGYPAPRTNVLTGIGNISGDTAILRVNGAQAVSVSTDQGTGNYGNHKLYIGRRGGTANPFNGRLYGLVIVGAAQSDAIVSALEKHMAMKTGVSF